MLFACCKIEQEDHRRSEIFLAIDTPLGFPEAFVRLVGHRQCVPRIEELSKDNVYLYRATERVVAQHIRRPLSAVQDQIGSQATKGMHILAKFGITKAADCGVWNLVTENIALTVIEAYPSACVGSSKINELKTRCNIPAVWSEDEKDALTCALVANLYGTERHLLAAPDSGVPPDEGWIWFPKDANLIGGEN